MKISRRTYIIGVLVVVLLAAIASYVSLISITQSLSGGFGADTECASGKHVSVGFGTIKAPAHSHLHLASLTLEQPEHLRSLGMVLLRFERRGKTRAVYGMVAGFPPRHLLFDLHWAHISLGSNTALVPRATYNVVVGLQRIGSQTGTLRGVQVSFQQGSSNYVWHSSLRVRITPNSCISHQ